MSGYVVRRLIAIAALAFGISVIVFLIIRLIPGDPVAALLAALDAEGEDEDSQDGEA